MCTTKDLIHVCLLRVNILLCLNLYYFIGYWNFFNGQKEL